MYKNSYTKSFLTILLAFSLAVGISCNKFKPKPSPDETPSAFKNRAIAISLAQIASFLDGGSDAIVLLHVNNVTSNNSAKVFIEAENNIIQAWLIVKESIQNGLIDKATRDKVKELLDITKQLNAAGVVPPSDPEGRIQFGIFVENLKTLAETLFDFVKGDTPENVNVDVMAAKMKTKSRALKLPAYLPTLGLIVTNTLSRVSRQSMIGSATDAYANGAEIIAALHTKNLQFLLSL